MPRHPVDEFRPLSRLIPFGLQHVLVMAAAPISSVFLVAKTLDLTPDLTVRLLSSTFVLAGLGTLLQSFGPWHLGARLPFVMLPGGAPVILFLAIAQEHGVRTAVGAVILTGAFYFVALPLFSRLLRFFPGIVIGTMIVLVGVTLIKSGAQLITGKPSSPGFGDPTHLLLGLATIASTVLLHRLLRGVLRQLAVVLGLVAGTALAAALGELRFDGIGSEIVALPTPLPFGPPEFDVLAAIPLLIFALASMAEATGQTVLNAEVVGKEIDVRRDAPRTIRGDGLVSLLGGFFGTSLMVTSGENIGIVRMTGVRSRYVTVVAGMVLVAIGLFAPLVRLIDAIPPSVVGGTAVVVFSVIAVMGVQMLRDYDLSDHRNLLVVAVPLGLGLIPVLVPGIYDQLPSTAGILLDSGVAVGAASAAVLNVLFNHLRTTERSEDTVAA